MFASLCVGCSMMEQRVDRMEAEVTKRLLKREDTAREYKRCMQVCWMDMVCCWITLCVLLVCWV